MRDIADDIAACAHETEVFLDDHLNRLAGVPDRLRAAMRHGALGGGKRLRPFLVRTTAALFGVPAPTTLTAGAALEMVHCYSLIHDDLPAMDDDDTRRGRPTVWVAFDEATAILAGDALLAEAFRLMADPVTHADPAIRAGLVAELAASAGPAGMVGGQAFDLQWESEPAVSEADIVAMNAMKTGRLIEAGVVMGAMLGRADAAALKALRTFGAEAGVIYQVADDLLDATATADALGKRAGKDSERGKHTLVGLVGIDEARRRLAAMTDRAVAGLQGFGPEARRLEALGRYFATRPN